MLLAETQQPTSQDAIAAIVATEGNLELAAERLFAHTGNNGTAHPDDIPRLKAKLTSLLAEDPQIQFDLQRILRTLSLLQAFSTFRMVAVTLEGTLENLSSDTRVKLYKHLLDSISILTDDHTSTTNANSTATSLNVSLSETVMRSLPPDVRDALKVLTIPAQPVPITIETNGHWSGGNEPPNAAR